MSSLLPLLLAFAAGLGLGLFYFGGLWLTVRQLPTSRYPVPLLLASFAGRTAVAVVGFYFVMGGRWERALACLVGFLVARFVLTSRLRPGPAPAAARGKEGAKP
jgi:F1F0 ATPase subunit 2